MTWISQVSTAKSIYNDLLKLARENLLEAGTNDRESQLFNLELLKNIIVGSQALFPSLASVNGHDSISEDESEPGAYRTVPFIAGGDESFKLSQEDLEFLGNTIHSLYELIDRDHPDDVDAVRKLVEVR